MSKAWVVWLYLLIGGGAGLSAWADCSAGSHSGDNNCGGMFFMAMAIWPAAVGHKLWSD